MIAGRQFHFRPVLTAFTALALAVLLMLGNWQLQRLNWKRDLIATVGAMAAAPPVALDKEIVETPVEYQPVIASGRFLPEHETRLFGTLDGAPGVYLFTPLRIEGLGDVYVNRGFAPQSVDADQLSQAPSGDIELIGLLRTPEDVAPPASWFRQRGEDANGNWYIRDPVAMASMAELNDVLPVYIDQYATEGGKWPKGGTTRVDFRNKHLEYALTWFGLAGALLAVWFALSLPPRD